MITAEKTRDARAVGTEVIIRWTGNPFVEGVAINLGSQLRAMEAAEWIRQYGVRQAPADIRRLVRNI